MGSTHRSFRWKALASMLLAATAGLALLVEPAAASGATTHGATRTTTRIYRAFSRSGAPSVRITSIIGGFCWSGSDTAMRDDAWRCVSGRFIYDPCFSSPKAKGVVLCILAPWSKSGTEIVLKKALPKPFAGPPSTTGLPWAIGTTTGLRCVFASGATRAIGDRRANYGCRKSTEWLWGSPSRSSEPWTIFAAPFQVKRLSKRAKIAVAWF